jgi:hypothetical protein
MCNESCANRFAEMTLLAQQRKRREPELWTRADHR